MESASRTETLAPGAPFSRSERLVGAPSRGRFGSTSRHTRRCERPALRADSLLALRLSAALSISISLRVIGLVLTGNLYSGSVHGNYILLTSPGTSTGISGWCRRYLLGARWGGIPAPGGDGRCGGRP